MKTHQPHRAHPELLLEQGGLDHRHKTILFQPLTAAFLGELLLGKDVGVNLIPSSKFSATQNKLL